MKKMTSNQIRNMWLEFFKEKGHKVEKGASLIPHNDPTLLWINSGVAALKKYFDGSEIPPSRRIVNVQKSIRTNDIENVGHTARHHTFFEMLGNFSIGDYFRKEVIAWAYEILTSPKWFGFDKNNLYVTYYSNDLETKNYWIAQGLDEDHLIPLDSNFWQIGEGPCGPNTEVFYDRSEKYDPDHLGIKLLKDEMENDRYIEIWGIVFSQYNAVNGVKKEDYKELPSKNIDTGAGLERICCIMQEVETNFDTDLFMPIIKECEKTAKYPYEGQYKTSYRVISDHIRACTFALSDGEMFSNEGRGYVLRRLIRRAMLYGQKIGIDEPFLYKLVNVVVENMKSFYPELVNNQSKIEKMVKSEEEKFLLTLKNGEAILNKFLNNSDLKTLPGEEAFKLYDTYGFPFDLTKEICEEKGVSVDKNKFDELMKKQRELARNARNNLESMHRQSKDLLQFVKKSEFVYDDNDLTAHVIGIFKDGVKVDSLSDEGDVIFDITNFYAESGGQIADKGHIENKDCYCAVNDVKKCPNGQHLHHIVVNYGNIKNGDEFKLVIDKNRRFQIAKNHSATHLLQAALDNILSSDIHQAGSFVSDDYVHFDFNYDKKITNEELNAIETKVNQWIAKGIKCETKILPIEQAKKENAKALFDEKYGDIVRVVCFDDVSKEFCGGTHVKNTSDIGLFYICFEQSIASGIRRIQFVTSYKAYEEIKNKENILNALSNKLNCKSFKESTDRLQSSLNEKDLLKLQCLSLNQKIANLLSEQLKDEFSLINGHYVLLKDIDNLSRDVLAMVVDNLKNLYKNSIILLISKDKNISMVCYCSDLAIKDNIKAGQFLNGICKSLNGSGGGRNDFAQGSLKDACNIKKALDLAKDLIINE